MSLDRGTTALAAAVLLTALAYGPLVPAVELPLDSQADDPVIEGFGGNREVGTTHQLSYRVVEEPTTVTVADGQLAVPPATVALAAGDEPVTLRYQLRVGDRSIRRTAVVPAGEARTVSLPLAAAVEEPPVSVELRIVALTNENRYEVYNATLGVVDDG
jgi:hypothetical protein